MVSIIILSFNTSKLLKECLQSVEKTLPKADYELIVVDNLSSDDSVAMVRHTFKNVKLIANTENAGFAKGCNLGAREAKGEYLLFLNSDTQLKNNPLPELLSTMNDSDSAAVVGGALMNFDGSAQRSYGRFYDLREVIIMLFGGDKAELKMQEKQGTQLVDWVSGGFLLIRSEVFKHVKGFDESYFMYIEDMDLCYRVSKKGYKVYHEPKAVVAHLGQGSSNKSFAIVNIYKGLAIFYKKHQNKLSYIVLLGLLRIKAYAVIMVGMIQKNQQLVETYKKALISI